MKINIKYLISFILLFIVEALIAIYVHDEIIRPYIGDILVVILLYTFVRAFIKKPIEHLHIYIFIFAVVVEIAQYFHIVEVLHLQNNKVLSIMIGGVFDIKDILCYAIGTIVLIVFKKISKKNFNND
ncbi:MAG: DUF2809 domain-containing protein [Clostridiaceae bacterium]|nr:DUF2809 domain-containing protein [Clostridiaceae bacterium]